MDLPDVVDGVVDLDLESQGRLLKGFAKSHEMPNGDHVGDDDDEGTYKMILLNSDLESQMEILDKLIEDQNNALADLTRSPGGQRANNQSGTGGNDEDDDLASEMRDLARSETLLRLELDNIQAAEDAKITDKSSNSGQSVELTYNHPRLGTGEDVLGLEASCVAPEDLQEDYSISPIESASDTDSDVYLNSFDEALAVAVHADEPESREMQTITFLPFPEEDDWADFSNGTENKISNLSTVTPVISNRESSQLTSIVAKDGTNVLEASLPENDKDSPLRLSPAIPPPASRVAPDERISLPFEDSFRNRMPSFGDEEPQRRNKRTLASMLVQTSVAATPSSPDQEQPCKPPRSPTRFGAGSHLRKSGGNGSSDDSVSTGPSPTRVRVDQDIFSSTGLTPPRIQDSPKGSSSSPLAGLKLVSGSYTSANLISSFPGNWGDIGHPYDGAESPPSAGLTQPSFPGTMGHIGRPSEGDMLPAMGEWADFDSINVIGPQCANEEDGELDSNGFLIPACESAPSNPSPSLTSTDGVAFVTAKSTLSPCSARSLSLVSSCDLSFVTAVQEESSCSYDKRKKTLVNNMLPTNFANTEDINHGHVKVATERAASKTSNGEDGTTGFAQKWSRRCWCLIVVALCVIVVVILGVMAIVRAKKDRNASAAVHADSFPPAPTSRPFFISGTVPSSGPFSPTASPTHVLRVYTFRPSTRPTNTARPSTRPTGTARPSTRPTNTARPSTGPTNTARPSTRPTGTARPSTRPTGTARPSTRPTDTARPPTRPINPLLTRYPSTASPNRIDAARPSKHPIKPPSTSPPLWQDGDPLSNQDLLEFFIAISLDGGQALNDLFSPQFQAYSWVAGNAYLANYTAERLIQRFALATLFYSTKGDSWSEKDNWLSNEDECLWFQRSTRSLCNENGMLTRLELYYNNLEGSIPPELGLLSYSLENLFLIGGPEKRLFGTIPSELGRLGRLTELRLADNRLTGSIPDEFGMLESIQVLDLSFNRLTGNVTDGIRRLRRMESLDLGRNMLGGELPRAIGDLTELTSLRLDRNRFIGDIPQTVGNLEKLRTLNLAGNLLTGIPSDLGSLKMLRFLSLYDNNISGPLFSQIGKLENLIALFLATNSLSGNLPTELGNLSNLDTLDLSRNQFNGTIPSEFGQINSRLRILKINSNFLSGPVPSEFDHMDKLNTLFLQENQLSGSVPSQVCQMFNRTIPTIFVDCGKVICPCCNYCCKERKCTCRYENNTEMEWRCF